MGRKRATPFIHSLRFKLAIASLSLLLIPWTGYRHLQQTESTLRQAQEALLLSRAEVVAGLLAEHTSALTEASGGRPSLYVHSLSQPVVADGYAEEWRTLLNQARRYRASESNPQALSFDLLAGYHGANLYLLIRVYDQTLGYPAANGEPDAGDHLLLALSGEGRRARQLLISTPAPGWVSVIDRARHTVEGRIRGELQESPEGYTVELRLPLAMVGERLSLAVIDRTGAQAETSAVASTSGWQRNDQLARLVLPNLPSADLLQGLDSRQHRYTILNSQRQVVGRHGSLIGISQQPVGLTLRLASLLLHDSGEEAVSTREHAGHMDGPEIRQALVGKAGVYRYSGGRVNTLSAAYPLKRADSVAGVILVEQNSDQMPLLQQQAMERLLGNSLLLILITGGTLFLLAGWLTGRIGRLNRKFSQAVSHDGRVLETVKSGRQRDELGELERSFASVLLRLQAYNHYLEQMASRLAHEFRTPLAMVQSSLENLQTDEAAENRERYTERAREGTQRLHLILNRLREATRLEQAMQAAELSQVDLTDLCRGLCDGYRLSHPQIGFECELPDTPIKIMAAPELIGQALDKLVANAVDFHTEGTPIRILLSMGEDRQVRIAVENRGSQLAEDMEHVLFQSMMSMREQRGGEPHLGLGLYLVKLIAEFHKGQATAENIDQGVRFSILI